MCECIMQRTDVVLACQVLLAPATKHITPCLPGLREGVFAKDGIRAMSISLVSWHT